MLKVTYLYHSGFSVETNSHFLVFDYWRNFPVLGTLKDGVINPNEIKEKDVVVFSSHRHKDHYNSVINDWRKIIKKCRVILSDDIPAVPEAKMVAPNEVYKEDDFTLKTYKSNDEGVAFLLSIDGYTIYHAGDLNWWHWEGEKGSWNDDIKKSYQHEMDLLKGETIDLAFIPLDPRLNNQYAWGIDLFMKDVSSHYVVPMHFGKKDKVIDRLMNDEISIDYRDRVVPLIVRGQSIELS